MKFKFRFADQIVGLFVLTSVVFICLALILVGINKRWLREDLNYRTNFTSATGLSIGMSVSLRGFKIGELKSISLNDNNFVDVSIVIYEEYINRVVENSVLDLQTNPLGFRAILVFYPGIEKGEPLAENSFINSTAFKEGRELIKKGLVDKDSSGDMIVKIMNDADELILNLNQTLIDLDETILGYNPGPIGEILFEIERIMPEITETIMSVNENTLPEVDKSLANVAAITSSIAVLTRELDSIEGIITKVLDPESSIATILNDDNALFNEIFSILNEIHMSMVQVRELTEYFNGMSPEISALVEGTGSAIEEAEKVLQGIKNNPLLRGGIEEIKTQDSVASTVRDGDF